MFNSNFKLTDQTQFILPRTHDRFVHLATISSGIREFMYFLDKKKGTTYIEEITGGSLNLITDEFLWFSLYKFLEDNKITSFISKEL